MAWPEMRETGSDPMMLEPPAMLASFILPEDCGRWPIFRGVAMSLLVC